MSFVANIPVSIDFIATTDTQEKKNEIEFILKGNKSIDDSIVRVSENNRGRDMSSFLLPVELFFWIIAIVLFAVFIQKNRPKCMPREAFYLKKISSKICSTVRVTSQTY